MNSTASALTILGANIAADTTTIGTRLTAVALATTTLSASTVTVTGWINSTGSALTTLQTLTASNTTTIYTAVNSTGSALTVETARAIARENLIGNSTGTLAAGSGLTISTANVAAGFNAASNFVQMTAANKLPAVDGSLLTGITASGGGILTATQTWSGSNTFAGLGYTTQTIQGVGVVGTASQIYGQFDVQGWAPSLVGSITTGANPLNMGVFGRYLYLLAQSSSKIQVYDIFNATAPVLLNNFTPASIPFDIKVQGRYAYVSAGPASNQAGQLEIYDVSNPLSITETGSVAYALSARGTGGYVQGKYYYLPSGMNIIDVSNVSTPTVVGSSNAVTNNNAPQTSVFVRDRRAYSIASDGTKLSLNVFDVSVATSPSLISSKELSNTAGTNIEQGDLQIQDNFAYVVSAIKGWLFILDITTPTAIVEVSSTSIGAATNGIFVQVRGKLAYVAGTTYFATFDVSNAGSPVLVSSVPLTSAALALSVQGRYAYVADASTIKIYDIGGVYAQAVDAAAISAKTALIDGDARMNSATISGGLFVSGAANFSGDVGFKNGISAGTSGTNMTPCGTLYFISSNTVTGSTSTTLSALTSFSTFTYAGNTLAIGDRLAVECAFHNNAAPTGNTAGVYLGSTALGTDAFATLQSDHWVQTEITMEQTGQALMMNKAYSQTATATTFATVTPLGIGQQTFDATAAQTFHCEATRTGGGGINFVHMRVSRACN